MFLLIIAGILLGDVAWWVWADRKVRRTRHPRFWRTAVAVWSGLLLGYLVWFLLFRTTARQAHAWLPVWTMGILYVWHLLIVPPTVIYILVEAVVVGVGKVRRSAERGAAKPQAEVGISRRQMLAATVVALPPVATVATAAIAMHRVHQFRIRRLELALPTLPTELDGMTIAHVTDLHVGRFTRPAALPRIVEAINQLRADLVLFTGDLIDLTLADLPHGVDFLRRLDPRSGLYLCEGNHDLIEDADGFEFGVRKAGLPLLLNESAITRVRDVPVQIMGLVWRRGDEAIAGAVNHLQQQRREDAFQILLAHHPHAFDSAAQMGIPLTLSGHTHGGQLMLTERLGAGPAMFRYWTGAYRKNDSALVVSNGVGNWFPVRMNAPADIVHLTLRCGERGSERSSVN